MKNSSVESEKVTVLWRENINPCKELPGSNCCPLGLIDNTVSRLQSDDSNHNLYLEFPKIHRQSYSLSTIFKDTDKVLVKYAYSLIVLRNG